MPAAKRKPGNSYIGFQPLKAKLARRPDVRSPAALAAWIGRRKYGAAKFQRAAARGHRLGNPNLIIHLVPHALFKRTRKAATTLAQIDADRSRRPVAIVDEKARRVLKFVRPRKRKRGSSRNPCAAPGRYRIRRQGGRRILEVYRA